MKYILASITFLIGFAIFVFLGVASKLSNGVGLGVFWEVLIMAGVFGATGYVFKKIGGKSKKVVATVVDTSLSKSDIKDFNKVFTAELLQHFAIKCVYVQREHSEVFDYSVHIDMDDFTSLNLEALQKKMTKRFYHVNRIDIIKYDEVNGSEMYAITS